MTKYTDPVEQGPLTGRLKSVFKIIEIRVKIDLDIQTNDWQYSFTLIDYLNMYIVVSVLVIM